MYIERGGFFLLICEAFILAISPSNSFFFRFVSFPDLNDWKRQSQAGVDGEAKSRGSRSRTAQRFKKGNIMQIVMRTVRARLSSQI